MRERERERERESDAPYLADERDKETVCVANEMVLGHVAL